MEVSTATPEATESFSFTGLIAGAIAAVFLLIIILIICKTRCICIPCLHRRWAKASVKHAETPYEPKLSGPVLVTGINSNAEPGSTHFTANGGSAIQTVEGGVSFMEKGEPIANGGGALGAKGVRFDDSDGEIGENADTDVLKKCKNQRGLKKRGANGEILFEGSGNNLNGNQTSGKQNLNRFPFIINGKMIPDLIPPPRVELLYKVETKPSPAKAKFDSSQFFSQISMRTSE